MKALCNIIAAVWFFQEPTAWAWSSKFFHIKRWKDWVYEGSNQIFIYFGLNL